MGEQLRVVQHAVLDDLGAAVPENVKGEGIQGIRVAQHKTWLAERPGEVLPGGKINGCFAAHGGIHGGKQGRGNLNEADAPQVACGGETRQIAHHAAAESDDQVGAGQPVFREKVQKIEENLPVFAFFPGGEYIGNHGKTCAFQALFYSCAVKGIDVALADDADFLRFSQLFRFRAQSGQKTLTDQNIILSGGADGNGVHPSTSSLRFLPSSSSRTNVSISSAAMASR